MYHTDRLKKYYLTLFEEQKKIDLLLGKRVGIESYYTGSKKKKIKLKVIDIYNL